MRTRAVFLFAEILLIVRSMKRIVIVGSPGVGKTTFARRLASITGLPLTHLDKVYYDQTYAYPTDKDAWRNRVQELTNEPLWIIDGNYKSTFDIRFPAADTIIFLDYPTKLTLTRALKRRIKLHGKVRPDMPSTWKERLDWRFIWFIANYRRKQQPKVLALLKQQTHAQVFHFTSTSSAEAFLDRIS